MASAPVLYGAAARSEDGVVNGDALSWAHGMAPLYCLAWIDPTNPAHQGQEAAIAKFPICIVPQDIRPPHLRFRSQLRKNNPNQLLLCYQVAAEEHAVPGPGHDILRDVRDSWLTLPGGIVPTKDVPSGNILKRRLYDPRKPNFRQALVLACKTLVYDHGFDGIFLDNCTIYRRFSALPVLGDELMAALQSLILEIRRALPSTILIGNTRHNWAGLNGEMNENRPSELAVEVGDIAGRATPRIEMFQYYMRDSEDTDNAEKMFRLALRHRCFFGAGINPQNIRWFDFYDRILDSYGLGGPR
jgi:hypothetical protein